MLGRRNNNQVSPRFSRRPTRDLSDSSCGSCGSETLSQTHTRIHAPDDTISLVTSTLNSTTNPTNKGVISRCKSDQDATADIFDRDNKLINCSNKPESNLTNNNNGNLVITNGRRLCLGHKMTTSNT